jgi:hypothetical protein
MDFANLAGNINIRCGCTTTAMTSIITVTGTLIIIAPTVLVLTIIAMINTIILASMVVLPITIIIAWARITIIITWTKILAAMVLMAWALGGAVLM